MRCSTMCLSVGGRLRSVQAPDQLKSLVTILPAKSDSDVMFVYKFIWDINRYLTCVLILSAG